MEGEKNTNAWMERVTKTCAALSVVPNATMLLKMTEIQATLARRKGVVVLGQENTCKTTMLTVLTHADGIHTPGCPVLPESMTTEQLYGTFVKHEWKDGVLPVLFRRQSKLSSTNSLRQQRQRHSPQMNASTSASNVGAVNAVKADKPEAHEHWIVMDGTVVMDRLNTVLDNNNQLCLNNLTRAGVKFMY